MIKIEIYITDVTEPIPNVLARCIASGNVSAQEESMSNSIKDFIVNYNKGIGKTILKEFDNGQPL